MRKIEMGFIKSSFYKKLHACSEPGRHMFSGKGSDLLEAGTNSPKQNAVSAYNQNSYAGYAKADFTQSTVNLVTCVLGAGALGWPFCFKECGLVLATLIMFVILVATRISYQLLLYCAQLSMRKTYEGIAEQALGKTGRQVVEFCIAAMNLGALVAFLDILADVLSAVAGTIIPPGAEPSRNAYITGVTLLGALPVCLVVRDHGLIAALSNASVAFVIIFAAVVFFTAFAPYAAAVLGFHGLLKAAGGSAAAAAAGGSGVGPPAVAAAAAASLTPPGLHMWHVQGMLVALPVMAYGFTAHQYYMGIYTMLKAPSMRKMKQVTDLALLTCAAVYWTVGVGGYATFGERTAGDVIRNLGGQKAYGLFGAYERALKLCYGMAILGNIPLVILPFYSILRPVLPADEQIKQSTAHLTGACTPVGLKNAAVAVINGKPSSNGGSGTTVKLKLFTLSNSSTVGGTNSSTNSSSGGSPAHVTVAARPIAGIAVAGLKQKTSSGGGWRDSLDNAVTVLEDQPCLQPPARSQPQQHQQPYHQQQLDPHLVTEQASYILTGMQHALVVFIVLGLGLASALWLPNVELIFGLTGSTASVLVAFIIPAVCFIKLYEAAPELGGSSNNSNGSAISCLWRFCCSVCSVCCCCCGLGSILVPSSSYKSSTAAGSTFPGATLLNSHHRVHQSPAKVQQVLVVPELRAQWQCRQRLAVCLLIFGIISGCLCTDAILSSISEEKAVVQLAQELVAHEAVVVQASRAQQKAKEAAAAVDAVSTAAKQLGAVSSNTNNTLGALTAAAAALSTLTNSSRGSRAADAATHSVWDFKGRLEERKQKVVEEGVLKNVEAALSAAQADIAATTQSVMQVVIKLDSSIAQIKADAASAAAEEQYQLQQQQQGQLAAAPAPTLLAPDGTQLPVVSAATGSSHIVPHGDQAEDTATHSSSSSSSTDSSSSGSGSVAYERASDMARELGKALGAFSQTAADGTNSSLTAGKSLEQVRDSAMSALTALAVTADVLQQVKDAVAVARRLQRDSQVKELAVGAMQRALNATAASALAMRLTGDALSTAANEETSELLSALTRVAHDLEKSTAAAAGSKYGARRASITVSSKAGVAKDSNNGGSSGGGSIAGTSSSGASAGSSTGLAAATTRPSAVRPIAGSAGQPQPPQQQQVVSPVHPTEKQIEAAAKANAAAHADSAMQADAAATTTAITAAAQHSTGRFGQPDANVLTSAVQQATAVQGQATSIATGGGTAASDASQAATGHAAAAAGGTNSASLGQAAAATAAGAVNSPGLVAGTSNGAGVAVAGSSYSAGNANTGAQVVRTAIYAGSSSGSNIVAKPLPAAGAISHTGGLSPNEADRVKAVIGHLANALSAASSSSSSNATAGGLATAGGATSTANVTELAAAIQDAVAWTQESKAAVLQLIVQQLGTSQPKVAQRVMGIVQDISITEEAAKLQQQQQQQQHRKQQEGVLNTTVQHAGSEQSPLLWQSSQQQQQQQEQQEQQEREQLGQQHSGVSSESSSKAAGPDVAVTADGQLQQNTLGSTHGPVVKVADTALARSPTVATDSSPVAANT